MVDRPEPPRDDPDDPTPLHAPPDPGLERRLREVMSHQAGRIHPGDRFADIEAEVARGRPARRWLWAVAAAAAVVLVAAAVVIPTLGQRDSFPASAENASTRPAPIPSPPAESEAGSDARESPTASATSAVTQPARSVLVPVYYLGSSIQRTEAGEDNERIRLYREDHTMPVGSTALAKVTAAISAMATGPLDPDYQTAWTTLGEVEVTEVDSGLRVNLAADGFPAALPNSFTAAEAIQQLVWTATAAYGQPVAVTVLVDGATNVSWGRDLFGTPVTRDLNLQAPVWITDPRTDQHDTAGRVTVIGISTSFEATLGYQIRDAVTADLITEGTATGGANGDFAPFRFTVDLEPGQYTVVVFAPDASGANPLGEGDSKTWYVD